RRLDRPHGPARALDLLLHLMPELSFPGRPRMAYETILVETRGKVGLITLNRPQALNALNTKVMEEVVAATQAFDADEYVSAIVLTGSEKAFAAGADIKEMQSKTYAEVFSADLFAGWDALQRIRKPIIAAVAGYALG